MLLLGPLIPLFWTSGDVSSGFQSQSWHPYSHLAEAYVIRVPCTYDVFYVHNSKIFHVALLIPFSLNVIRVEYDKF